MHALLYQSHFRPDVTYEDVCTLIADTSSYTSSSGVTGLFLFGGRPGKPDRFVEWIEGPKSALEDAYDRIALDTRHQDARVMATGLLDRLTHGSACKETGRLFTTWSVRETTTATLPSSLGEFLSLVAHWPRLAAGGLSTAYGI